MPAIEETDETETNDKVTKTKHYLMEKDATTGKILLQFINGDHIALFDFSDRLHGMLDVTKHVYMYGAFTIITRAAAGKSPTEGADAMIRAGKAIEAGTYRMGSRKKTELEKATDAFIRKNNRQPDAKETASLQLLFG